MTAYTGVYSSRINKRIKTVRLAKEKYYLPYQQGQHLVTRNAMPCSSIWKRCLLKLELDISVNQTNICLIDWNLSESRLLGFRTSIDSAQKAFNKFENQTQLNIKENTMFCYRVWFSNLLQCFVRRIVWGTRFVLPIQMVFGQISINEADACLIGSKLFDWLIDQVRALVFTISRSNGW